MTLYKSEVQIYNIFNHNCAVTAWLLNGRRGMLLESNLTFGKASAFLREIFIISPQYILISRYLASSVIVEELEKSRQEASARAGIRHERVIATF